MKIRLRQMRTVLFVTLGAAFLVSLGIHWAWANDQFFLNLSTEVIGIGTTVFLVDRLIRADAQNKRRPIRRHIRDEIDSFFFGSIDGIASALGLRDSVFHEEWLFITDDLATRLSLMNARVRDQLIKSIPERLEQADDETWDRLADGLDKCAQFSEKMLDLCSQDLTDKQVEILFSLRAATRESFVFRAVPTFVSDAPIRLLIIGRSASQLRETVEQLLALESESWFPSTSSVVGPTP